ncbi:hypothetical protein HCH_02907 [Hahella chejuensis KCTC 2396]|uniref:LamG-like jellyroll fold domain-containing protein n=1 Tax=Hahella chejuensis (strain KCTC 2396) TaxID=349521 RepID=Q2SI43_HAHCH|nr:LamG-like jellyroll fold domain-containing protein [Hahella chejuensis]ABC29681.1 hypothetical protein HCH_02907 [Hahella chejuensis KCTC 2396]
MGFYDTASEALTDGMIHYWKVDEYGDLTDHVGSGLNAELFNPNDIYTEGQLNESLVETPLFRGRDVTYHDNTREGAIGYIFRPVTTSSTSFTNWTLRVRAYLKGLNDGGEWQYALLMRYIGIGVSDLNYPFGATQLEEVVGTSAISLNEWHDFTLVKDAAGLHLYVDGTFIGNVASDKVLDPYLAVFGGALGVSDDETHSSSANYYWNGIVDDVGVWSRALTSVEVGQLVGEQIVGDPPVIELGSYDLPLEITVGPATGSYSLPVEIDVTLDTGALSLPVRIDVYDVDSMTLPLAVNVYGDLNSTAWSFSLRMAGVDVSERIIGTISIEAEEDSARVAQFTFVPESGVIDPDQYLGAAVEVFYLEGGSEFRLFRGLVDVSEYSMGDGIFSLTCTDNRQEHIERLSVSMVDALGGAYSDHVFDGYTTITQYFEDVLSTIPASYDLDVNGVPVLSSWAPPAEHELIDSQYITDSVDVVLASRRDLLNEVKIFIDYRYPVLRERSHAYQWNAPFTFLEFLTTKNHTLPNRDMIEGAVSGTGWSLKGSVSYTLQPESGYISLGGGKGTNWIIDEQLRQYLALGANFVIATRWDQTLTERYALTVSAPAEIAAIGAITQSENIVLDFDNPVTEFDSFLVDPPGATSYVGLDKAWVLSDYDALQSAVNCAYRKAVKDILGSHRQNSVTFSMPINPVAERSDYMHLLSIQVEAKGKVRRVRHDLNLDTGAALTEIELACYRVKAQNADALYVLNEFSIGGAAAPIGLTILGNHIGGQQYSLVENDAWTGYVGNMTAPYVGSNLYNAKFAIATPEIPAATRDPLEYSFELSATVYIPQDLLTITV